MASFKSDILNFFDSFSIVLNFGFNGQTSVDYEGPSAGVLQCKDDEVYDPISESCKQVYCPIGASGDGSCQELDMEVESDSTEPTPSTNGLCMINMKLSLPKKVYDVLLPRSKNLDNFFAELLEVNESSIVVDFFVTQENRTGACMSETETELLEPQQQEQGQKPRLLGLGVGVGRYGDTISAATSDWCWVNFQATFIAYLPMFPHITELCTLLMQPGTILELQKNNGTLTIANRTFTVPPKVQNQTHEVLNTTAVPSHNGTENFTKSNVVKEVSMVSVDSSYCSRVHGDNKWRSYSYRAPRYFVLTRSNFRREEMDLSYTWIVNGKNETVLQSEQLLYLAATRRVYKEGEYELVTQVASKLSEDSRGSSREAIGYAVVCEYKLTNCTRLGYEAASMTWGPNKSAEIRGVWYVRSGYVWLNFDEIAVCVDLAQFNLISTPSANACNEDSYAYLFYWSMLTLISYELNILSIACSTIVLFTYIFISELHNLPGYNMINLSIASILSKLMFAYGSTNEVASNQIACVASAVLLHYFLLTELMWMTVLAYHAFDVFVCRSTRVERVNTARRLLAYCACGWGIPALWVSICFLMDRVPMLYNLLGVRFYYGEIPPNTFDSDGVPNTCWINNYSLAFYIFGIPLCIIVLINCSLFIVTCYTISKAAKQRRASQFSLSHSDASLASSSSSVSGNWTTRDVQIFARLSLVTGVAWVTALLFVAIEGASSTSQQQNDLLCAVVCIAEGLFVVAQGSLGIMQFYAYIWSPRILAYYLVIARRSYNRLRGAVRDTAAPVRTSISQLSVNSPVNVAPNVASDTFRKASSQTNTTDITDDTTDDTIPSNQCLHKVDVHSQPSESELESFDTTLNDAVIDELTRQRGSMTSDSVLVPHSWSCVMP